MNEFIFYVEVQLSSHLCKDTKNSQKNGKIWINKVSVWY